MKLKSYILFFNLILTLVPLFAQENQIELNVGFGRTLFKSEAERNTSNWVNPRDNSLSDLSQIGFMYYHKPQQSFFRLKAGVSFYKRGEDINRLNYLRFPMGIDLQFGKKVYLIIGGGGLFSILQSYREVEFADFPETRRNFQLIAQSNAGVGFKLNKDFSFTVGFQNNFDLTNIYLMNSLSPGGAAYSEGVKGREGFFFFAFAYQLK